MQEDFLLMKSLVGENLREDHLKHVDCYVFNKLGIFIPSTGVCGYAQQKNHTHPSYMITIMFSNEYAQIDLPRNHYPAAITSPDIPHRDISTEFLPYYCIMIEKEYFESQYGLYGEELPEFHDYQFPICNDIIKAVNTFAFECGKHMKNKEITLQSQMTIITHWIIRSLLGENMDMRSVSSDYAVARVQHYIEQHYGEDLSVEILAAVASQSESTFQRGFKRELGTTPMHYLMEVRVEKAKLMLRRSNVSLTDISDSCGFGSSAHLSAVFKKHTGVTPSEYRRLTVS